MTDLIAAAKALGVARGHRISSPIQFLALLDRGLPITSLDRIARAIAPTDTSFRYRIVPKATQARLRSRRKLNRSQGVIVTRLANIWSQALQVWKSPEDAREFLYRPHPLLENRTPIDLVLENEIGAQLVADVLGRLEHGSAV